MISVLCPQHVSNPQRSRFRSGACRLPSTVDLLRSCLFSHFPLILAKLSNPTTFYIKLWNIDKASALAGVLYAEMAMPLTSLAPTMWPGRRNAWNYWSATFLMICCSYEIGTTQQRSLCFNALDQSFIDWLSYKSWQDVTWLLTIFQWCKMFVTCEVFAYSRIEFTNSSLL